jgi:hypothetical protein
MFGMETLDVAIGLALVFFLFSLVTSAVREAIEGVLKERSVHLERGVRELLDDKNGVRFAKYLYEHPLVSSLYHGKYVQKDRRWRGGALPTYIPSRNFAVAVLDLVMRGPVPHDDDNTPTNPYVTQRAGSAPTIAQLREAALRIEIPKVQRALLAAIDNARDDISKVQTNLESWFDTAMDSVSGSYKRWTQVYLFVIGAVATLALNVNAITIANYLAQNKTAREAIVLRAQAIAADTAYRRIALDTSANVRARIADLNTLDVPIGWDHAAPRPSSTASSTERLSYWTRTFFGLLLTAFAVTLGAPFWFDVLNKIMVIRSTVKPHEKSQEEASEDRQASAPASAAVPSTRQSAAAPTTAAPTATAPTPAAPAEHAVPRVTPPFTPNEWASGDEEGIL